VYILCFSVTVITVLHYVVLRPFAATHIPRTAVTADPVDTPVNWRQGGGWRK